MQCALCNGSICCHGIVQVKDNLYTCLEECGLSAQGHKPPVRSLPVYQGEVVAGCEVWSPVCDKCFKQKTQKGGIKDVVRQL